MSDGDDGSAARVVWIIIGLILVLLTVWALVTGTVNLPFDKVLRALGGIFR